MKIKVYPNSSVKKIIAGIPKKHKHLRLIIEFNDQTIILHEATVAAIVRAYINIVAHPVKRAILYEQAILDDRVKKKGYAKYQLVEKQDIDEDTVLERINKILNMATQIYED